MPKVIVKCRYYKSGSGKGEEQQRCAAFRYLLAKKEKREEYGEEGGGLVQAHGFAHWDAGKGVEVRKYSCRAGDAAKKEAKPGARSFEASARCIGAAHMPARAQEHQKCQRKRHDIAEERLLERRYVRPVIVAKAHEKAHQRKTRRRCDYASYPFSRVVHVWCCMSQSLR